MANLRFNVVEKAFEKKALEIKTPAERPSEYFGKYVFNQQKMFKYLPLDVYTKLRDVIDNGSYLDLEVADKVAEGIKNWAVEMGVTHCTHWFQPLTGITAEKHDAFGTSVYNVLLRFQLPTLSWHLQQHQRLQVTTPHLFPLP